MENAHLLQHQLLQIQIMEHVYHSNHVKMPIVIKMLATVNQKLANGNQLQLELPLLLNVHQWIAQELLLVQLATHSKVSMELQAPFVFWSIMYVQLAIHQPLQQNNAINQQLFTHTLGMNPLINVFHAKLQLIITITQPIQTLQTQVLILTIMDTS